MPRRYVFADESGDFVFAKGQNISRYFIVCTIAMDGCDVGVDLLTLRRRLIWDGAPLKDFFHATNDKQIVRDAVFKCIADHKFTVQATIMEKSKAQSQVRRTEARFYKTGWYFHFKHALAKYTDDHDELLITAASIGTKKGQGVFTDAVNDVVQQHLRRDQWAAHFCSSASDPCLQVVDYCTWAIQRKWERDDNVLLRSDLQKHRIVVQTDPNPQLPQVIGDRIQLQQVLLNLITNAIDSMANEDRPGVLSIKSEVQDGGGVMISVADTEKESARKISIVYSIRSSRQNRAVWGWVCRSAALSSRPTRDGCGLSETRREARCFNFSCAPIPAGMRPSEQGMPVP